MIARRVDGELFEIIRATPQVMVTDAQGTLVASTLQLLTRDGEAFEEPLTSTKVMGFGWSGTIKPVPNVGFPGIINPVVWIKPTVVTAPMKAGALEITLDSAGDAALSNPANIKPRWKAEGASEERGYSLRPTVRIANCMKAKFTPSTPGSQPDREDEGNLAAIDGGQGIDAFGIVVDVDGTSLSGLAIKLSTLLDLRG